MVKVNFLILCFLVVFTPSSFALGHIVSYKEMKQYLFGSIEKIETCGDWDNQGQLGEFRIFTVYYSGQDLLFVDIVALNDAETELRSIYGFSFDEINNDHAAIEINSMTCESAGNNRVKISAVAVNGNNDKNFKFFLLIDGVNRSYQYSELPKN